MLDQISTYRQGDSVAVRSYHRSRNICREASFIIQQILTYPYVSAMQDMDLHSLFISSPKTGIYCLIIFLPNNSIINAQKMPRSYSGAFTAGEGAHCLQEVFLHNVEGVAFWQVL